MNQTDILILVIVGVLCLFYIQKRLNEVRYVKATEDGRMYLVQNKKGKETAANKLARLNRKIEKLIKHLQKKKLSKRLEEKYHSDSLSEGTGDNDYTAYTVNKGERMVFCLRSKKTGKFVTDMVLTYVAIHELAHIYTDDIGHTPEFWKNMKFLLKESIELGIYKKIDFAKNPVEYCGINIKSSII